MNLNFNHSKRYSKVIIICLLFFKILNSQESVEKKSDLKSVHAEKIYLQLNSTVFTTDKIIWFKAIVTEGIYNTPTKTSAILHVELIDFDKQIINHKLLKLEKGIANGYFQLKEKLKPGRYLIRAYTEWNKNFGQDFINKQYIDLYTPKKITKNEEVIKDISITETELKQFELTAKVYPQLINPNHKGKLMLHLNIDSKIDSVEIKKDKQNYYTLKYLLPKNAIKAIIKLKPSSYKKSDYNFINTYNKSIIINKEYLDLQFFPEGGKLINGLISKIGFKALDYSNKGTQVVGNIIDQYDSIIVPFKNNKLGMGAFFIKANIKKKYFGSVTSKEGVIYKYPLPKVNEKGLVLKCLFVGKYLRIAINSNYNFSDNLNIKIESKEKIYHNLTVKFNNNSAEVAILKEMLPKGISKISVLNNDSQPICERLIFNMLTDDKILIEAKTHVLEYEQRDKTILKIKTKDNYNSPLISNLSVLVLNKEQLGGMHQAKQNILSYFLLNSELKGTIESPMHYFNEKNKSRNRDMDALMLTQGWRNYKYDTNNTPLLFNKKPEKNLNICGTIRKYGNIKKIEKKPIDITMMTFGKKLAVQTQEVDSTGYFNFNLKDEYADNLDVLIQSKNDKDKQKNYTINIHNKQSPKINYKSEENIQLADSIQTYVEKNIERKQTEENYKLSNNTIALDEIVLLENYKMTPEREKMMALHGKPDVVIEDKELHEKIENWSYGLFSVLLFNYPDDLDVTRFGGGGSGFLIADVHGADFTCILIDGIPVFIKNYPLIGNLPTEEIKSVEIIKRPKNPRKYAIDIFGRSDALDAALQVSFINIYTYSKNGLFGVKKTPGIFKGTIPAFSLSREFYSPKYESLISEDWKIPDLRSIIHWEPNLITDAQGAAEISFYNDDNIGDMLIVIEGITEDGEIGYYDMTYKVKERIDK